MIEYRKAKDREDILELCLSTHPQRESGFLNFYFSQLYDKGTGLIVKEEDKVISTLQLHEHTLAFHGRMLLCSYISGVSTHLDYRKRGKMNDLMNMAIDISSKNYLVTFVEAYNPKLYKKFGFETISYRKKLTVSQKEIKINDTEGVQEKFPLEDLIHVYENFASRFDCYYVRDREYYEDYTSSIYENDGKIIAYYKDGKICGYCVYYERNDMIEVSEVLYVDSHSLLKLLKYAIGYMPYISFEVSSNEHVEKVFKLSIPRTNTCVMARVNNYALFNKLFSCKVKNVNEAFEILKKPTLLNEKY